MEEGQKIAIFSHVIITMHVKENIFEVSFIDLENRESFYRIAEAAKISDDPTRFIDEFKEFIEKLSGHGRGIMIMTAKEFVYKIPFLEAFIKFEEHSLNNIPDDMMN